jgi:hypothetical protein
LLGQAGLNPASVVVPVANLSHGDAVLTGGLDLELLNRLRQRLFFIRRNDDADVLGALTDDVYGPAGHHRNPKAILANATITIAKTIANTASN